MTYPMLTIATVFATVLCVNGYNILVIPYSSGFNSRLLNVQKIADILAQDGHQVSVLMNNKVREHTITKHADIIEFKVPNTTVGIDDINFEKSSLDSTFRQSNNLIDTELEFCEYLMQDKATLMQIEKKKFDLIFADMGSICSQVLISNLKITTIFYMNVLLASYSEFFYPIFPSFVCTLPGMLCKDEDMTFSERVLNFMKVMIDHYFMSSVHGKIEIMAAKNGFILRSPIQDSFKKKILIVNAHYTIETPMPSMPHVFPISGLFHQSPSPLPKEFSDIIKASQPHGTILMSFGTLMPDFDADKADMFARVLGRLPHQIIWRFTGKPPKSLQPNTHLVKWFPQNDLLANPSVKMFITHCGISSTHESAHHGIPVLAIPLFVDQDGNAAKLTKRLKMGVRLDFYTLTVEELEKAVKEVLSNPGYSENAKKASYLLNDHIVPPQQQLRHLVNFTIKSGGAPHLFHPYALDMNWFQFYGLDVLCVLLSVPLVILVLFCFLLRTCTKKFINFVFGGKRKMS